MVGFMSEKDVFQRSSVSRVLLPFCSAALFFTLIMAIQHAQTVTLVQFMSTVIKLYLLVMNYTCFWNPPPPGNVVANTVKRLVISFAMVPIKHQLQPFPATTLRP